MIQSCYYLIDLVDEPPIFVFLGFNFKTHANVKNLNILVNLVLDSLVSAIDILESLYLLNIALHIDGWF